MGAGGVDWASAGTLDIGGSNTFDPSTTVAGSTQPYWSGWWVYTPTVNTDLTVDTFSTTATVPADADTMIYIYDPSSTVVGYNDDHAGGPGSFYSQATASLTAGVTYHIRAGSYDNTGDGITLLSLAASVATTPPPPAPPLYAIGGVTAPVGGDTVPHAVTLGTAPLVTYPTLGFTVTDGNFNTDSHEWYKWTAPSSGIVAFDVSLTYDVATSLATSGDIEVYLYTSHVGPTPTGFSDLTYHGGNYRTAYVSVTAGTTYWIAVAQFVAAGSMGMILRISDYGATTAWARDGDQQWVIAPPTDNVYADSVMPSFPFVGGTQQPNHMPDYPAVLNGPGLGRGQKWDIGYHGTYAMSSTFGGPWPGTDSNAWACAWPTARKGNWGGQNWGLYPLGDGSPGRSAATWNGTDPYTAGSPAGSGTCLIHTGTTASRNFSDSWGLMQMHYESDSPGGLVAEGMRFDTWASCQRLNLTTIRTNAGPGAGAAFPTPPTGFETAAFEWEDTTSTVLDLDAAPDELMNADRTTDTTISSPSGLSVEWHITVTPTDENPSHVWGPDRANSTWVGDATGPSAMTTDHTLATYSGGLASWEALGSTIVNNALAEEAAGADAGIRAVLISPDFLSDSIPGSITPTGSPPESLTATRHNQVVSFRVHLRPSRYRWLNNPTLPPVDLLTGVITGALREPRTRFFRVTETWHSGPS